MKTATKVACVLFIISLVISGISFSDENEFPKVGFIKNDKSNVRAGDNINFERLCQLEKGDPVKIIGKRYSWFKINLPNAAHLYIKNDYVDLGLEKKVGVVNVRRVNLRAGPGTKFSSLGQVSKPDKMNVLSEEDGWYKIIPPEGVVGWIHDSQISFTPETAKKIAPKAEKTVEIPKKAGLLNMGLSQEPPKPKGNLTFSEEGR